MHHAPVDPQAVPSLHVAQGAVTHLTLQTEGSLTALSSASTPAAVFVEMRDYRCLKRAFNHLI